MTVTISRETIIPDIDIMRSYIIHLHCSGIGGAVVSSFQGLHAGTSGYLANPWEGLRQRSVHVLGGHSYN